MVFNRIAKIKLLLQEKAEKKVDSIDLLLVLTLDLISYEIKLNNCISDKTGEAISQITAFFSIEYYYHFGFLELDSELKELLFELKKFNIGLANYDLGVIGLKNDDWVCYFEDRIRSILTQMPISKS